MYIVYIHSCSHNVQMCLQKDIEARHTHVRRTCEKKLKCESVWLMSIVGEGTEGADGRRICWWRERERLFDRALQL